MDASGNLFGTTYSGGSSNMGTVYELAHSGSGYSESLLHSFPPSPSFDGQHPMGRLAIDALGNLYGTTSVGGYGDGMVYEVALTGSGYEEVLLSTFGGAPADRNPRPACC